MAEHDVMIYGLKTCRWCKKTRYWFEDEKIPFRTVDVDSLEGEEAEAMREEVQQVSGGRSFPVTVVDGTVIVGYSPEKFEEAVYGPDRPRATTEGGA